MYLIPFLDPQSDYLSPFKTPCRGQETETPFKKVTIPFFNITYINKQFTFLD